MLLDDLDESWRSVLTQVLQDDVDSGIAVKGMGHVPRGLLSKAFRRCCEGLDLGSSSAQAWRNAQMGQHLDRAIAGGNLLGVQNIVSGEFRAVHATRMRFYAHQAVNIMADVKDVVFQHQHVFAQGYVEIAGILELAEADDLEGLPVLVDWIGFDQDKCTWQAIEDIWHGAPGFLGKAPREMRPYYLIRLEPILHFTGDLKLPSVLHAACSAR